MTAAAPLQPDGLFIGRARMRGLRASRPDAERWLAPAGMEALGLGADEILYVPHLALHIEAAAGQGAAGLRRRLLDALERFAEAAERDPPPGRVTTGACRFSSRARYLAWVAGLWLAGGNGGRSAAAAAIGAGSDVRSLSEWQRREVLAEGVRLVPVVAHLARAGMAATWAAGLDSPDRVRAKAAIAARFGLDLAAAPAPAVTLPGEGFRPAGPGGRAPRPGVAPRLDPPLPPSIARAAAILAGDGGAWHVLDEEARTILLAACALADSPSDAGRPGFAEALRAAARDTDGHPAAASTSQTAVAGGDPLSTAPDEAPGRPRAEQDEGRIAEAPTVPIAALGHGPGADAAESRGPSRQPGPRASGARAVTGAERRAERSPDAPGAVVFTSRYAGLLFLLNAFVALGLYPDFTAPGGYRLAPSPLWLADRIGRARFGGRYRADPLARWIAARAQARSLPRRWRADEDWLRGFQERSRPRWSHSEGRATLWHSAGFPLVDAPEHARLRARHRRGSEAPVRSRLPHAPDARWIACLRLYLEARLRLATGDARGLTLLALPGEIRVDELDLTAVFRLDAHPIGLRIAGLDRDLGWQPAEGRSIRFRFE